MQTDRFLAHIYNECPQLDPDVVHECTLIVIDALCEQMPAEQTRRMASQLPEEIGEAAADGAKRSDTSGVPISLDYFYGKIEFRTELGHDDTRQFVKAVIQTLNAALSDSEEGQAVLALPSELDQLLIEN